MILSYFGTNLNQFEIAAEIRPHPEDRAVFPEGMVRYFQKFGLEAMVRVNGDAETLKALVSNGIPVIVETLLNPDDDIGHYRVTRGYDDSQGIFIFGDPYFGPEVPLATADLEHMWRAYNHRFIPVYLPEQESVVKAILGQEYDEQTNLQHALEVAQEAAAASPDDPQMWLNVGEIESGLGQYQAAADNWEQARTMGLPARTLWYIDWPVAAYNELGQYETAIALSEETLAGNPVSPELIYDEGIAYIGLGDQEKARERFELALNYDPGLVQAQQALESLE
jgi:tetratricopeptide (TPR) repeat protein